MASHICWIAIPSRRTNWAFRSTGWPDFSSFEIRVPTMRIGSYVVRAEPLHVAALVGFAGFVIWYALDAWRASPHVENTILIVPTSIIALLLIVAILPQAVRFEKATAPTTEEASPSKPAPWSERHRAELSAVGQMILLGGFVFLIPVMGFDIATFVFVAASMFVMGERRWPLLLLYPALFALALTGGMKAMMSIDLMTTIV